MDEEWLLPFKDVIAAKTGLRIRGHDNKSLAAHIHLRTSHLALNSPRDYYSLIVSDTREGRAELKGIVNLLMVGESYFFRDKGQFRILKEVVLPELIERKSKKRELRVWSAGCSTGEEPYSLGILLDEILPERDGWKISITGTDIREDFLEKARAGVYGDWSFRQVDESIKKRWFRKKGVNLALEGRIRDMVSFYNLDVLDGELPDYARGIYDLDLILCRNMFLYYNRQSIARMLEKITAVLNVGGYFMTAHGELFSLPLGLLKPKVFAESVLYEKMDATREAAPAAPKAVEAAKSFAGIGTLKASRPAPVAALRPAMRAERLFEGADEVVALFKQGSYSSVIKKAQQSLKERPNDYRMLYLSGAAYANLGELEKAAEHLQRASTEDRLAPEPYYILALIAEEEGDRERAKAALNKAIYIKKDFVAAYLELASLYEYEGAVEKAKRLRSAALDEIKALPADSHVDMYDNATAGELAIHIKKTIGA